MQSSKKTKYPEVSESTQIHIIINFYFARFVKSETEFGSESFERSIFERKTTICHEKISESTQKRLKLAYFTLLVNFDLWSVGKKYLNLWNKTFVRLGQLSHL